jgi:hypothetical protein
MLHFFPAKKSKKGPMAWEKIFIDHMLDKGLAYRIYKELKLLLRKNKKTSNSAEKDTKDFIKHFIKDKPQTST